MAVTGAEWLSDHIDCRSKIIESFRIEVFCNMRLKNKVAIIAGEMNDVGEATVRLFIEQGAKVVVTAEELADLSFKAYIDSHEDAAHCPTDSMNPDDIQRLVQGTLDQYGKIDILVCTDCNAAMSRQRIDTLQMEDDAWRGIMNQALTSQFLLCKYVIPPMQEQEDGSIVFISSIAGLRSIPMGAAYSAAKSGIHGLMRCISADHSSQGVRANAVCAGFYCTENDRFENVHPIGRVCVPDDIAQAVLFLASDESKFITGITLPVDGGLHTS